MPWGISPVKERNFNDFLCMKLIHLNVESFKYFDALVDFLETEKPDIVSLVEATNGNFF